MRELKAGRPYPLPSTCQLVAMRAMSVEDSGHPIVDAAFSWLRAAVKVQQEMPNDEGFLYHGDDVHAGEAVAPLTLWEGMVILPFVGVVHWEEGLSFSARVGLRQCFEQLSANLTFVNAAPLRCQPRLLLAPIVEASEVLKPVRALGEWFQGHRSAKLPVMIPLMSRERDAGPVAAQVEGWR